MLKATGNRLELIGGLSAFIPIDSSPVQRLRSGRCVSNFLLKCCREASAQEPRGNAYAPLNLTGLVAVGSVSCLPSAVSCFDESVGFRG